MTKDFKKHFFHGVVWAGVAVRWKDGVFYPMRMGLLNGDISLLKKQAMTALYLLYFGFMRDHDLRSINLGIFKMLKGFSKSVLAGLPGFPNRLVQNILRLKDELFLNIYVVNDLKQNEGLKGIFICKNKPDPTFLKRLYPQGYTLQKETAFRRKKLLDVFNARSAGMDFIVADVRFRYIRKETDSFGASAIIPKWVDRVNDSFNGFSDFARTKNRNVYSDIQALKKYNYDHEFTRDEVLLKFFYEKMYVPYIHNRYPDEKMLLPYAAIREDFKKGWLLLVRDKSTGKYVSGSIVNMHRGVFSPRKIGILDGDFELLKKEVLSALYVGYFRFMEQNKLRRINVGGSRAFLNDGVLKYKEKWAPVVQFNHHHDNVFILRICRPAEAMDRFLLKNPFISMEKGQLVGNVFVAADINFEADSLKKIYAIKGLPKVRAVRIPTQQKQIVFPLSAVSDAQEIAP
ncbi:MAG: hypothetical protein HZA28_01440 [Candidatus Omnitrophica bacterium]|nr:hypothetical protein [Candidatus Omnitrophota bacterium]